MEKTERIVYFDYLRVFAIFAVIMIHVAVQNLDSVDVNGFEWQTFNFFSSISRWGVPVFVMISGVLFLNKEIPIKDLYLKYSLRLIIAFIIWSVIYLLCVDQYTDKISLLIELIHGHYHMWFIPMIIGLYICVPIIKLIVNNEKIMKYYLILVFIFAFLVPWTTYLAYDFGNKLITTGAGALRLDIDHMFMYLVLGYAGYFVLGYCLNKVDFSKRQRTIIYLLGFIGFASTIGLELGFAFKTQKLSGNYYGNFSVNVLLESIAVFVWFRYQKFTWAKLNLFVRKLSRYTFGAYLVHVLILEQLKIRIGLHTLSFNPVFAAPSIGILIFIISFIVSAILNQIPVVKKYMV